MKPLLIVLMVFSLTAQADEYLSNEGTSAPESFTEKSDDSPKTTTIQKEEIAPAMKNKTGVNNGVSAEDVNTSPNKAPTTDEEVIEGAALTNEGVSPDSVQSGEEIQAQEEEIEAQEEGVIDYSTMPEGSDVNPFEPDLD